MKVLLIDDHPLIQAALSSVIQGLGDNVQVITCSNATEARQSLEKDADYDLTLLDLQLGDSNGFDLLTDMRARYPSLPVVVISASDRTSDVIRAIDMGAMGFVPKRASNETLIEALQQVLSGGVYVPPMSMGVGADSAAEAAQPAGGAGGGYGGGFGGGYGGGLSGGSVGSYAANSGFQTPPSLSSLGLTPRQTDVLSLLLKGQPNKLIAGELGLSVETGKDHVAAVLRALNVSSRTQAVLAVSQMLQTHNGYSVLRPSR